jgi:predicted Zn-dependent peptidase
MKHISILSILSFSLLFACTPKTGDQMAKTQPTAPAVAATAPKIPIPTGDVRKKAPTPGEAPKIQIGKANTFKLDNGLTVILVENHKLPIVSYRVFVNNDPVLEKEAAGYVQMMGELLSKGTKNKTKAQIDEDIDFIGASLNSNSHGISGECLAKHSDKFLSVFSDVLLNPSFPADELEKAKKRQQSALAQSKTDANTIAANVASVLRNGKSHPYGEIMTEESLGKITLDQVKGHYAKFFKPNISYLVVVGDITRDKAEKYARQYFGKWQKGEVEKMPYGSPRPPEKTQVDFVHKAGAVQSVINITYPVELMPGTKEAIEARLTNAVVGGYFNSRVNASLREKHGWTYGARSSLIADERIGQFTGTASVRNAVTDSSIVEFMKELNRLRNEKVPAAELQVVKNVLTGQFSQSLEQPGTVADFALNIARFGLAPDFYEKYLETLQKVSADEVQLTARKFIHPERAHILVVGNKDEVADKLKQFAADGKINFYDASGNPVKYNNAVLPADMTAEKVIEDYIRSIGGVAKIDAIKDIQRSSEINTGGPTLELKSWQKGGTKVKVETTMNGQTISKRLYDGTSGMETGMAGASRKVEGESLGDLKEQAMVCKETGYKTGGYKLTLKGIEEVNGSNAYILEVVRPDGKKSTEYYDMKTSLKVRETSTRPGQTGEPVEVTFDYFDYKETSGVMFPTRMTMTGLMPAPLTRNITEVKVNAGIDDGVFKL